MAVFIGALIRNEHRDIAEWVRHHNLIGVEHITLYDNHSNRGYDKELGQFIKDGYVDIKEWPGKYVFRQHAMFCDYCFNRDWGDDDWGAFIDADEFIHLDCHKSIEEFVDEYREFAGVVLSWIVYGANGHLKRPPKTHLHMAYTKPVPLIRDNHNFKSIARFKDIAFWNDVHRFTPKKGKHLVNVRRQIVHNSWQEQIREGAHIKHYITKSWQEFIERLERGNITPGIRNIETFFMYNQDMLDQRDELIRNLDVGKFPTLCCQRDMHDMLGLFFTTDIFVRLNEAYDSGLPDEEFKKRCIAEIPNFCTFHFNNIKNRSSEQLVAIEAKVRDLIDMQSEFVMSIPHDTKDYRKAVVEAIINTPFHRNVMPVGEL